MRLDEYLETDRILFIESIASFVDTPTSVDGGEVLEIFKAYKKKVQEILSSGQHISISSLQEIKIRLEQISGLTPYIEKGLEKERSMESQLIADIQALL